MGKAEEQTAVADTGGLVEPVAYSFELARYRWDDGREEPWTGWGPPQLSYTAPSVPNGAVRNLVPLVAADALSSAREQIEAMREALAEAERVLGQVPDRLRSNAHKNVIGKIRAALPAITQDQT